MNFLDKDIIIERYEKRFSLYGDDVRSLASGTRERQQMRFQVMLDLGIEPGSSILDLGCGLGDFYEFLEENGIDVNYTGYDLSPKFISAARKKYPQADFRIRDIQTDTDSQSFDYIVCTQVFNNNLVHEDVLEVCKDVLSICYKRATKGVAFDFLSTYVDFKQDSLYYYSPHEIFSYCKTLSKRVCLRHDYPLFEFTIYIYPDFEGWGKVAGN